MGWVYDSELEPAGAHLLGILKQEQTVRYSRFYGKDVDSAALAAATSLTEDEAHVLIEFAAGQLEDAGIVSFTPLPDRLIDGENDYVIALTEKGKTFLASGAPFKYRHMDL